MTKKKIVIKKTRIDKRKEAIKKALKAAEELLIKDEDSIDIEIFENYICLSSSKQEEIKYSIKENPSIPKADTAVWVQDFDDDIWLPRVATGKVILDKIETYSFDHEDDTVLWECWQLKNPNKGNKNGN